MPCNGDCDTCSAPIILNGEDPGTALDYFKIRCKAKNIHIELEWDVAYDE